MFDSILENAFELVVWLVCELLLEFILINLVKLVWYCLKSTCWIIGGTLVFLFTVGSIRASSQQQVRTNQRYRNTTVYYQNNKKYLEYNTVVFLGALFLTASTTVFLFSSLA